MKPSTTVEKEKGMDAAKKNSGGEDGPPAGMENEKVDETTAASESISMSSSKPASSEIPTTCTRSKQNLDPSRNSRSSSCTHTAPTDLKTTPSKSDGSNLSDKVSAAQEVGEKSTDLLQSEESSQSGTVLSSNPQTNGGTKPATTETVHAAMPPILPAVVDLAQQFLKGVPSNAVISPAVEPARLANGANPGAAVPVAPSTRTVTVPIVGGLTVAAPLIPSKPIPTPASSRTKQGSTLRRGKWTVEEEAYVARVIKEFNSGFLNAPAGTTLRSYLSEKLHCDPMRITKKFTGDACIGKRVFHPAVRSGSNAAAIDKAQAELDALERRWRRRMEMQQRESAKKAAASAAAAVATATGKQPIGQIVQEHPVVVSQHNIKNCEDTLPPIQQNVATCTASWLDRANAVLKGDKSTATSGPSTFSQPSSHAGEAVSDLPQSEIMNQMKEVQRLIHEGPFIQQTTHLLEQNSNLDMSLIGGNTDGYSIDDLSSEEHAEKRPRRSLTGAEDAEALVGFLRSVRASAASGRDP